MSCRLNVRIPNVEKFRECVALGGQTDEKWIPFNDFWFGENEWPCGIVRWEYLLEFYAQYIAVDAMSGEYEQFHTDLLKEMIDYAVKNKFDLYFDTH